MNTLRLLLLLALGTALTSCASSPMPEPSTQERLRPPTAAHELPRQAGAVSDQTLTPPAPHGESPSRLTLGQALALAERLHPELAASEAEVQAAEGRALQAGLFPNPELVARTEAAPVTGSFASQAEYVVGLSQPFPLGSRLSVARRVETLDRERLVHEREGRRREVRVRVQSAFATALYAQRVIQARSEDVGLAEDGARVANARLEAGDAIPAEVGQAEVERGQAQLARDRALSLYEQAREALATAMGNPAMRVESLEGTLEEALSLPSLERLITGLPEHPAVASAEANITVQRERLELAKVERTPDVNVDVSYRRLGDVENAVDVGLRLPIPFFNRNQGRIQEVGAEIRAAEAKAQALRHELTRELQASHRKLTSAVQSATLLREEILPRAERVLESAEARYRSGDMSLAELLPIRRDWTRARLDYLEALHEVMQAWSVLSPYAR
jgi:cobalt-zinc-cadmium efflux system outer membrane protein